MSETLLGFDYGKKRIGVAVGQNLFGTTQGIDTIDNTGANGPWSQIKRHVDTWQPVTFIVGMPVTKDGNETNFIRTIRCFGAELESRFNLPVEYFDETLTSRAAETFINESTSPGKRIIGRNKSLRDRIAAEIILTSYMAENMR